MLLYEKVEGGLLVEVVKQGAYKCDNTCKCLTSNVVVTVLLINNE